LHEIAAAVIEDETRVRSSIVASQLETHGKYGGGVVPELASREHLRAIVPVGSRWKRGRAQT
jgi:N6-L-threonylcarbamoyladenine synthase